mmetsp:Transcript_20915/g.45990  ORF Transcript_20915/g.45990 Transcript_20915/m.45990 type:complete len:210 (-) Transcript_20915:2932-3561(-)
MEIPSISSPTCLSRVAQRQPYLATKKRKNGSRNTQPHYSLMILLILFFCLSENICAKPEMMLSGTALNSFTMSSLVSWSDNLESHASAQNAISLGKFDLLGPRQLPSSFLTRVTSSLLTLTDSSSSSRSGKRSNKYTHTDCTSGKLCGWWMTICSNADSALSAARSFAFAWAFLFFFCALVWSMISWRVGSTCPTALPKAWHFAAQPTA